MLLEAIKEENMMGAANGDVTRTLNDMREYVSCKYSISQYFSIEKLTSI